MKYRKIVETSIYSFDLEKMKEFYIDKLAYNTSPNKEIGMCS
jgi:hypothetical protein